MYSPSDGKPATATHVSFDMTNLEHSYREIFTRAEEPRKNVVSQIEELLKQNSITLGVPVESRVKTWSSICEKIERKGLNISDIRELPDLVGVRLILLFRKDVDPVIQLIRKHLNVVADEDASTRLGEREFGYQSQHLVAFIPDDWKKVPTLASLGEISIEIQIRMLTQHVWAAASHKLQYKNEEAVPPPIRRTINRVAALLETVDLEFDRVRDERENYTRQERDAPGKDEPLNVDNLAAILAQYFPAQNRLEDEPYAELLQILTKFKVESTLQLHKILRDHKDAAFKQERQFIVRRGVKTTAFRWSDLSFKL